ncbi:MAG: hypothetical protein IKG15_06830 [Solobacterium sp.]|nr:hypothetical protein [Solobacterium sp.]
MDGYIKLVDTIEADLTEEEEQEAIRQWLFTTAWLNEITGREFNSAEDILRFVMALILHDDPENMIMTEE